MSMERLELLSEPVTIEAGDGPARRTITGQAVPWNRTARVRSGQLVRFLPGSVTLAGEAVLRDHQMTAPIGIVASESSGDEGLAIRARVSATPAGDEALTLAGDGVLKHFSVGVDPVDFTYEDGVMVVAKATAAEVSLLVRGAFGADAAVSDVTATPPTPTLEATVPDLEATVVAEPVQAAPIEPPAVIVPSIQGGALVRDPYPYSLPHEHGGPSFVRDAYDALPEVNPNSDGAHRWRTALAMHQDPRVIQAGMAYLAREDAGIQAATGTTTLNPDVAFPHQRPDLYVRLRGAKAPIYSSVAHYPTPDFNSIQVPRTTTETSLSGLPTDQVTPIAAGSIGTTTDTVTMQEVEGAYLFSRMLLLGSNPAIDRIALDAMERAWLADVETRATTFWTTGANVTAASATYADGQTWTVSMRGAMAALAAATLYAADVIIPPSKEYIAGSAADDTTKRPLLPYLGAMNSLGTTGPGYETLTIQGVPVLPGPYMPANKVLLIDTSIDAAVIWVTPVMNFRLEWTTDVATGPVTTGGNVKVLKLVKYSGVGFWSQYKGGIVLTTNTTPLPLDESGGFSFDEAEATNGGNGGNAKAKK
jgi:hypothetical protein